MTVPRSRIDSQQEELALSCMVAHKTFPGRTGLYIAEVAKHLTCTERHIINLIEEYETSGGASGLKGYSIARGWVPGMKTPRECWRVAVTDLDAFIAKRATSHQ